MEQFNILKLKAVAKVLKQRFPNLSVEETLDLSGKILEALDELGN